MGQLWKFLIHSHRFLKFQGSNCGLPKWVVAEARDVGSTELPRLQRWFVGSPWLAWAHRQASRKIWSRKTWPQERGWWFDGVDESIYEHCLVDNFMTLGWHVYKSLHFCGDSSDSLLLSALEPWNCCFWSIPFCGKWGGFMPPTSWEMLGDSLSTQHVWWPSFNVVLGESPSITGFRNMLSHNCLVGERGMHFSEEGFPKLVEESTRKQLQANAKMIQNEIRWVPLSSCLASRIQPLHRTPCLPQTPGNRVGSCSLEPTAVCAKACIRPLQFTKLLAEKRSSGKLCYLLAYHGFLDNDWWQLEDRCESSWSTVLQVHHPLGDPLSNLNQVLSPWPDPSPVKAGLHICERPPPQGPEYDMDERIWNLFLNKDSRFPLMNTFFPKSPTVVATHRHAASTANSASPTLHPTGGR